MDLLGLQPNLPAVSLFYAFHYILFFRMGIFRMGIFRMGIFRMGILQILKSKKITAQKRLVVPGAGIEPARLY